MIQANPCVFQLIVDGICTYFVNVFVDFAAYCMYNTRSTLHNVISWFVGGFKKRKHTED